MRCSRCGVETEPDWKYCAICGLKVECVSYLVAKRRLQARLNMIVDLDPDAFPITEADYQKLEKSLAHMVIFRNWRLHHD